MKKRFKFPGGRIAELDFPESGSTAASSYIVGIKKGGSTLMAKIMRDLAPFADRPLFEFPSIAFREGFPWFRTVDDIDGSLRQKGYIYGVFRWLPENDLFDLGAIEESSGGRKARFLTMFRDPRDVLVSLYYSDLKSHAIPQSGPVREQMLRSRSALESVSLDSYVLEKSRSYLRHYYRTLQVEALGDSRIIRYEDIIYDKPKLVSAMIDVMQAEAPAEAAATIARKHDQIPEVENENKHVRQVHPGNYRKKLRPETIEQLNEIFAVVLNKLDYPLGPKVALSA